MITVPSSKLTLFFMDSFAINFSKANELGLALPVKLSMVMLFSSTESLNMFLSSIK